MKIAITGGTGFVGRHLAERLAADGHQVVVIGRGDPAKHALLPRGVTIVTADITDEPALEAAFSTCEAVAHCAGINREIGSQTYARIHVAGTRAVVEASYAAGVERLVMLSFLRARPDGPTEYHRSKWQAEELVRGSGRTWTILKAGVIHGRGDHMLDHLSHAFFTFPIFGLVGLHERPVRPVAA
jgi:NADH dehydrogenase